MKSYMVFLDENNKSHVDVIFPKLICKFNAVLFKIPYEILGGAQFGKWKNRQAGERMTKDLGFLSIKAYYKVIIITL